MTTSPKRTEEISLGALLAMLWRRKLTIAFCASLSLMMGLGLLAVIKPRFTAYVSILLDPRSADPTETDGEFTAKPVDSVKIGSVVSVIQSDELLDSVVSSQDLTEDPEFMTGPGLASVVFARLLNKTAASRESQDERIAKASENLRKAMDVQRDGFTYVIKIGVVSQQDQKSKRLAQAIAEAYLNQQINARREASAQNLRWLAERLRDLGAELKKSQTNVELVRRNFDLSVDEGGSGANANPLTTDLNHQIVLAQADSAQKRARAEVVSTLQRSGGDLGSLPEVVSSPIITQLRVRRAQISSQLDDMLQRFGKAYPAVSQVENDRQTLDDQITNEIKRIVANVQDDYETAIKRERGLEEQALRRRNKEGSDSDGRNQLRLAQNAVEANQQIYNTLLSQYKTVEQRQTLQVPEARIISPALLPSVPSFPKPVPFTLVAIGLGLAVGCGLALLTELMDRSFATPADIERVLGLPVLATVPRVQRSSVGKQVTPKSLLDYAARDPFSQFSESLRSIRSGLFDDPTRRARVVQFTSPMPGEGKSTLAACVGVSAARDGLRTVVIDCDFRHPSTSSAFDAMDRPGVAEFLEGSASLGDVLMPTWLPSLAIIPIGKGFETAPKLLNSARLLTLIRALRKTANFVIIDSAAIEAVADAAMIAQVVDRTVMIVRWRSSERAMCSRAIARIQRAQGQLGGVILNNVNLSGFVDYGYYSRANMRQMKRYFHSSGTIPRRLPTTVVEEPIEM